MAWILGVFTALLLLLLAIFTYKSIRFSEVNALLFEPG